jgi:hypothetical protein
MCSIVAKVTIIRNPALTLRQPQLLCQVPCQQAFLRLLPDCCFFSFCLPMHVSCCCSIALHQYCTCRVVEWLLQTYVEPVYGAAAVAAWQQLLGVTFQVLWLMPLYAISIMVSCIW